MLHAAFDSLENVWGPFRLLNSYTLLAALIAGLSAMLTFYLLPRLWARLPTDSGRQFAVDADKSIGKPVSAGVILVGAFSAAILLLVPLQPMTIVFVALMILASFVGYLDDHRVGGLSQLALGVSDLVLSLAAALLVVGSDTTELWLPFYAGGIEVPSLLALPVTTGVIWLAINAMNCSDGVDGLSGTLAALTLTGLAGLLYVVVGNVDVAGYLRIPHNPLGADWALVAMAMIGCLFGYLWFNAPPSAVLMGDSGSRPIGLLIGTLVAATGNPAILVICGSIILANGATGLAKVLLIRLFKIRVLHNIRFPLHDHVRKNLGWTGTQVLIRFSLLHIAITALLMMVLLKVR